MMKLSVNANGTYDYQIMVRGQEQPFKIRGTYTLSVTAGRGAFATGFASTDGSTAILMSLSPTTPKMLDSYDRRRLLAENFIADTPVSIKLRFELPEKLGVWTPEFDDGIPRYYERD